MTAERWLTGARERLSSAHQQEAQGCPAAALAEIERARTCLVQAERKLNEQIARRSVSEGRVA